MNYRSLLFALLLSALTAAAQEWTRFRGPNGSGVSIDTGFPSEFNKKKNLIWRTPVRPGKSSPVLTRRHIFLTALDSGKLFTQCFNRETGKLVWERSVRRARVEPSHTQNHPAAITPVTDGETVYSFFPEYGLVAYDANGKERWRTPLGPFSNENGHSSCPIIAGDNVILIMDQMLGSSIAAFDRRHRRTPVEDSAGGDGRLCHAAAAARSLDGNSVYYLSDYKGFRCIQWQALDPATKRPVGERRTVRQFHNARQLLAAMGDPIGVGLSVTPDKLFFSMVETTGNI